MGTTMDVRFREVDPFNCWLRLRFSDVPSRGNETTSMACLTAGM